MSYTLILSAAVVLIAAYLIHNYRTYLTHRINRFDDVTLFEGSVYHAEHTDIIKKEATSESDTTVICFPGFLENQHYFLELYQDEDIEFIGINNANYYSGFVAKKTEALDSSNKNPYEMSSIEHDAFVLCQVIEKLATRENIIVHGHSRGGAVILEAGRQRPDLTQSIRAILEAPVLPKAKVSNRLEMLVKFGGFYTFPLFLNAMRRLPTKRMITERSYYPLTERKKEILSKSSQLPKQYSTAISNMHDIRNWQLLSDYDLYGNFKEITVVLPEQDSVLCRKTMHTSARAIDTVNIVETNDTNHFITLEKPEAMRAILFPV